MITKRNYGILMPISCLPSSEGIGTMGKEAYNFVDFLKEAHAEIWQILPLNPTSFGDSPYQSCCSNALNYYFIDLQKLVEGGLLTSEEVESTPLSTDCRRVNYSLQFNNKLALLRKAFERFDKNGDDFKKFLADGEYGDFALFMTLKHKFDYKAWDEWEEPYRSYNEKIVKEFIEENRSEYEFWQFTQFIFLLQWNALKSYAHGQGISIMGDIPLYLAYDSVEVWKYGDMLFKVDKDRKPTCVAGVPPDIFSEDGQLWGNPVYDWVKMRENGYEWWNDRISKCLKLFDILRVDHFRGFDRYYEIPAGATTARDGVWVDGPKEELFNDKLDYNIVAEDLGLVDDGILRLMKNTGYPGMKLLEFAFDGDPENVNLPSKLPQNSICYTGTHDNMPLKQFIDDLTEQEREVFIKELRRECRYFDLDTDERSSQTICEKIVELAFHTQANMVIIPMWDLLAMGGEARINFPSTLSVNNWSWRFLTTDFKKGTINTLKKLAKKTKR